MLSRRMYSIIVVCVLLLACKQEKRYHDEMSAELSNNPKIEAIRRFQKDLNQAFKNPETSPLPDKHRKDFDGLDFFPLDTNYIVEAKFERTPEAKPFMMSTTTSRKTKEVVYGIAHFTLNGENYQLEVYQNLDEDPKDENYLFLPFYDETNGNETYSGGRYIDLSIPNGDTLVIDFNRAYNPYCVYNKKYSCPLVPRQNYLRTNVRAGVKDFQSD